MDHPVYTIQMVIIAVKCKTTQMAEYKHPWRILGVKYHLGQSPEVRVNPYGHPTQKIHKHTTDASHAYNKGLSYVLLLVQNRVPDSIAA